MQFFLFIKLFLHLVKIVGRKMKINFVFYVTFEIVLFINTQIFD
jgi:hypothetical protein